MLYYFNLILKDLIFFNDGYCRVMSFLGLRLVYSTLVWRQSKSMNLDFCGLEWYSFLSLVMIT